MNQLLYFIRRNLRLFCGNRLNILLSFASVLIVIGIYMLFLRDFLLDTVTRAGVESTFVKEFTDRFMLAGLLIGFIENFAILFVGSGWRDAIPLVLIVLFMLLKPSVFGIEEKA